MTYDEALESRDVDTLCQELVAMPQAQRIEMLRELLTSRSSDNEHLCRMLAGIDRGIGAENRSLLVDQVADAIGITGVCTLARPVGHPHLPLRVAQEREGEVELVAEVAVVLDRVEAHANDLDPSILELVDSIPESLAPDRIGRR